MWENYVMSNELKNKIIEKNYPLGTLMLASPYETRCDRDICGLIGEDDFDKWLYVQAPERETILENNFKEEILRGRNIDSIYYINASSGSGKTTYLRHFLYTNSNEISSMLFDFFTATSTPMLLNDSVKDIAINNERILFEYEDTKYKFISVIITQLDTLINKNSLSHKFSVENLNEEYFAYLQNIANNFTLRFSDNGEYTNLLLPIKDLFDIIINVNIYSDDLQREYLKFKKDFLDQFVKTYISLQSDIRNLTLFLLRFVIIVLLCRLDNNTFDNRKYNYILAFDNIEHFIDDDAIYDEDILFIESVLEYLLKETEDILSNSCSHETKEKGHVFKNYFRILLSIRDTTNFLKKQVHSSDFPISNIDVTTWFDISIIHKKRFNFFGPLLSDEKADVYNTMQLVLSDVTRYKNSSGKSLEEMYNHNKRRITLYLGEILECDQYRNEYKKLRKLADDTRISKTQRDIFKSASRSYINRLMLDKVGATGYFNDIYTSPSGESSLGKGYARRILNYLNIKKIEGNNNYIGFNELVRNVFKFPLCDDSISEKMFNDIAHIIIKMNDHNMKTTNWCQLVLVKFAQKKLSIEALNDEIMKEYSNEDFDTNYGIKITEAGAYFLDLLPKFEYYSCRYCRNSRPLFSELNYIDSQGNPCERYKDIIKKVKENTFNCIEELHKNDDRFFLAKDKVNYEAMYSGNYLSKSQTDIKGSHHIKNVIIDHISYLDRFRGYILLNESDRIDKKGISSYVLNVIKEYIVTFNSYLKIQDPKGVYYIDNYSHDNTQRYVDTITKNVNKELGKIDKNDLSYDSIFPDNF